MEVYYTFIQFRANRVFLPFLSVVSQAIGLNSMLGVYLVLFVGMVVAFLTLLAEIYWKRKGEQGMCHGISDCWIVHLLFTPFGRLDFVAKGAAGVRLELCFHG